MLTPSQVKESSPDEFAFPKNLHAKMFAVKLHHLINYYDDDDNREPDMPELDEPRQPVFSEVGLMGTTEVRVEQGHALFSGLRFATTSYNHNEAKFFLVIVVFALRNQIDISRTGIGSSESQPMVLASTISSPILVNSRKLRIDGKRKIRRKKRK